MLTTGNIVHDYVDTDDIASKMVKLLPTAKVLFPCN